MFSLAWISAVDVQGKDIEALYYIGPVLCHPQALLCISNVCVFISLKYGVHSAEPVVDSFNIYMTI